MRLDRRTVVTSIVYIFIFWFVLPLVLLGSAAVLDRTFLLTRFTGFQWFGLIAADLSGLLLALSIVQFTRQAGVLPVSAYPPKKIVRNGIFSVFRHPIYLFYTILFAGIGLDWGSPSMLLVVMPAFVCGAAVYIYIEERILRRRFGIDYEAYREHSGVVLPKFHVFLKLPFFVLSKMYFPIRVEGRQNIPDRAPFFLVANHRNYLDPFLAAYVLPYKIHYVTTHEMFRRRFRAWFFRSLGCIPKKRYLPDDGSVREIIKALKNGSAIGIFPEGERSYTGELQGFKPEPMKLFMKYRDVPVLPVAISGNFLLWPRWGRGWRRTRITIAFKEPIRAGKDEQADELAGRIRDAIRPDDSGLKCRSEQRAHELQQILYRCPRCRQFDGLKPEANDLACERCGARLHLTDEYRIEGMGAESTTIADLYGRIKVSPEDLANPGPDGLIARTGACEFLLEKNGALERLFFGTVNLYGDRLALRETGEDPREAVLKLKDLRSATIEGVNRLQCFDCGRGEMYRIVLLEEPARKWQDWISEACRLAGKKNLILR